MSEVAPASPRLSPAQRRGLVARQAITHLSAADDRLARVIDRVGPHRLIIKRDPFITLVSSIVSQQISMAAAASIQRKLMAQFEDGRVTPETLLRKRAPSLRRCGLSAQKVVYLRDLAAHFADGRLSNGALRRMDDEQVISATVAVKGIGRWTAEMLLIFCLERPDVWPVDDLGIRKAVRNLHGLPDYPSKKDMQSFGEPWRPYRSFASWYLWRSLEGPLMPGVALADRRST